MLSLQLKRQEAEWGSIRNASPLLLGVKTQTRTANSLRSQRWIGQSPAKVQMARHSGHHNACYYNRLLGKQEYAQMVTHPRISIYVKAPRGLCQQVWELIKAVICSLFKSLQVIFSIDLKRRTCKITRHLETGELNQDSVFAFKRGSYEYKYIKMFRI